jgi:hypothetical protein
MPVNSTHLNYDDNAAAWSRARDVFAGEDAIKSAGERYLPKLDSQSADEYNAYRARASFFNATARTADGFVGLIFRREPTFKIPGDGTDGTARTNASGVGRALAAFVEDGPVVLARAVLLTLSLTVAVPACLTPCCASNKNWSQLSESNRRPTVYKTVALPLS